MTFDRKSQYISHAFYDNIAFLFRQGYCSDLIYCFSEDSITDSPKEWKRYLHTQTCINRNKPCRQTRRHAHYRHCLYGDAQ